MPKFLVELDLYESHKLEVEADSAEDAQKLVEQADEDGHLYELVDRCSVKVFNEYEVGEAWEVKDEQIS